MNVSVRRSALVLLFVSTAGAALGALDLTQSFGANLAYYFDEHKGIEGTGGFLPPSYAPLLPEDNTAWITAHPGLTSADPVTRKLGSGWGAAELEAYYRLRAVWPVLAGSGPLTEGNSLAVSAKAVATPVSVHLETEAVLTPIAFLQLRAGALVGTGWPLDFLGLHGLALNDAAGPPTVTGGLVTKAHLGATFQFDLAALVPGEMNHVVVSLTAKTVYQRASKAGPDDAWYWRADRGENFDGWVYAGEYAVGWQPPWRVNFIGLLAEHEFRLDKANRSRSTVASGGWGSDFASWRFGPVVNIRLAEDHGLTVLLQFKNGLYYTEDTVFYRWFESRSATGDAYVKLDRLALAYTWNF